MTHNKKGYNNPSEWEKIEKDFDKRNEPIIVSNNNLFADTCVSIPINDKLDENGQLKSDVEELSNIQEVEIIDTDNFDEVLQLTEYDNGQLAPTQNDFVVAEYHKIDTTQITKNQQKIAKVFIDKVTKFITDFDDVQLTADHEIYLKQVGRLQLQNLTDLLTMAEMNKGMINNIVEIVNTTQAEDYAIINSYNMLVNQHLKLIKELTNLYKSIPSTMKKLRADVLTNQELLGETNKHPEMITEDYGDSQFNNSKELLKKLIEERKESDNKEKEN